MNSWIGHAFPKWKVGKVGKFGEAEIGNRKSEAKIAEVFLQIFSKLNNNTHQYTCIEIEIGIRTNWEKLCRRNNVFFCGKFARKILILANFWKRKVFFYFEFNMILRRLWKVLGYKYIDKLDYLHTHIHIVFCKHINNNAFAKLNRF